MIKTTNVSVKERLPVYFFLNFCNQNVCRRGVAAIQYKKTPACTAEVFKHGIIKIQM